eukprot:8912445-Prorocentrum_lima.AAC.1
MSQVGESPGPRRRPGNAWGVLSPGKSGDEDWCSPVVRGPSVERDMPRFGMVDKVGAAGSPGG